MSAPVLKFENVGKLYHLGTFGTGSLTRDLTRWWKINVRKENDPYLRIGESNDRSRKGKSDVVWALKNISFDVNQGEVIGIIGKNGAGKSTLLKLLSRITSPSTGIIRAKGRVASLLEVGTGFHTELTGRENIYMNGTVMGMTKHEIDRKLDEIVDFAGVERYLDTPVKRYSSGMMVRLGFAVAAFLEPEILVVDEVLAVGDAEFQKKALGKMQAISSGQGRTVLFVSHNMAAVRALCTRSILLDKGEIKYVGSTDDCVSRYLAASEIEETRKIIEGIKYKKDWLDIHRISLNGTELNKSVIKSGQEVLTLIIEGYSHQDFKTDPMLILKNRDGVPLASLAEGHTRGKIVNISKGQFKIERNILLPKFLSEGTLVADINLHHPMMEWQLKIPNTIYLQLEGYYEHSGRPARLVEEGLIAFSTTQ